MPISGTFGGFPFDPEVYQGFVDQEATFSDSILASGILARDQSLATSLDNGGVQGTIRFYNPLDPDKDAPLVRDGETDNVPTEVSGGKQSWIRIDRMKAWKATELTRELTAADPMAAVARNTGRYWRMYKQGLLIKMVNAVLGVSTLLVLAMFRDSEHISAAYGLALTVTMITTTILLAVYIWHDGKRVGAVVFTVVFLAIQFLFFFASMAKFLHGGWFTMLLTLAILLIMYTWNEGTKLERAQRRHMQPADCVPVLKQLHEDDSIPYFTDNIVYLTSDPEMKRVDTDIFFSIFADHPKRARAWWAVSVETSDNPFTREYSVENFGTDFLFRVRIRLGFKVSQSIPAYIHQIMNDLSKSGDLPKQTTRYPKLDADPNIGPIRYVLIHKALMPESKVSQKGAISLQIKYAIRHLAGSPVKWFGLAPYNPLIEIQPLFLATERPPRLKRV